MPHIQEYLDEVNEIFGFYFDIVLACNSARREFLQLQATHNISDDSPFMVKEGPPSKTPDEEMETSIHSTTLSAVKSRMDSNGFDTIRAAEAAIIFAYHVWEEKYRNNLTKKDGTSLRPVSSDIMGDLRLIRNSIIHNKGITKNDIVKCKIFTKFSPGERIALSSHDICAIISEIRKDLVRHA